VVVADFRQPVRGDLLLLPRLAALAAQRFMDKLLLKLPCSAT
jgi:hypothetical protein